MNGRTEGRELVSVRLEIGCAACPSRGLPGFHAVPPSTKPLLAHWPSHPLPQRPSTHTASHTLKQRQFNKQWCLAQCVSLIREVGQGPSRSQPQNSTLPCEARQVLAIGCVLQDPKTPGD